MTKRVASHIPKFGDTASLAEDPVSPSGDAHPPAFTSTSPTGDAASPNSGICDPAGQNKYDVISIYHEIHLVHRIDPFLLSIFLQQYIEHVDLNYKVFQGEMMLLYDDFEYVQLLFEIK
jgi:hypothetical protein